MSKKEKNILITSTDLILLNTLLYLYDKLKSPVSIPDIEKETGIRYTTIRYSINKFKKLGILEEHKIEKRGVPVTGYVPKTKTILVIDKNYLLVILDDLVIPLNPSFIDFSPYIGKTLPLDQAPDVIKTIVEQIHKDLGSLVEYGLLLKRDYLDILFQQYMEMRKQLYS